MSFMVPGYKRLRNKDAVPTVESCLDITEAENVPFHLLHSHLKFSHISRSNHFFHFRFNMLSVIYSQLS